MAEYKCKTCDYIGTIANFAKPCPKCGKNTIIAHLGKKQSEIAKIFMKYELRHLK